MLMPVGHAGQRQHVAHRAGCPPCAAAWRAGCPCCRAHPGRAACTASAGQQGAGPAWEAGSAGQAAWIAEPCGRLQAPFAQQSCGPLHNSALHLEVKIFDIVLPQSHHQAVQLCLALPAARPATAGVARRSSRAQHCPAGPPAQCEEPGSLHQNAAVRTSTSCARNDALQETAAKVVAAGRRQPTCMGSWRPCHHGRAC